tara:strand:+ start:174040 stop:175044 length:1005 start_codon:yes stop_codon:yes gene_type:complete
MTDFIDAPLINLIITRIYTIVAALIISIPIGMLQSKTAAAPLPPFWLGLNKVFLAKLIKLNVEKRTDHDLFFRGLFVVCFFICVSALLVIALNFLPAVSADIHFLQIAILAFSISTISPFLLNKAIQAQLTKTGKLTTTLEAKLSICTMRALSNADNSGINRSLIHYTVYSFIRHLIAPILFFLIGGLPLLIISTLFLWLTYAIGKTSLSGAYTYTITLFEELLSIIPNFIGTTLIVMATFITPKASFKTALHALSLKHSGHLMPGVHPLAITAYAINISIGGKEKSRYGATIDRPWYGPKDAKAKVDSAQVKLAQYMIVIAQLLGLFALMVFL